MKRQACSYRNMLSFLKIVLLAAALALASVQAHAVDVPIQDAPSLERMMETMRAICREPRPLGSPGEQQSADYLEASLANEGYSVFRHSFSYAPGSLDNPLLAGEIAGGTRESIPQGMFDSAAWDDGGATAHNIAGVRKADHPGAPILLLSAHYDTVTGSIGVTDNASGVAVVLELAHLLKNEVPGLELWVVFFTGEECYLLGSRAFIRDLAEADGMRLWGVINVDCVSRDAGEGFGLAVSEGGQLQVENAMVDLFGRRHSSLPLKGSVNNDHYPFHVAGFDALTFGRMMEPGGQAAQTINTPRDDFYSFDQTGLPEAAHILLQAIREADAMR